MILADTRSIQQTALHTVCNPREQVPVNSAQDNVRPTIKVFHNNEKLRACVLVCSTERQLANDYSGGTLVLRLPYRTPQANS